MSISPTKSLEGALMATMNKTALVARLMEFEMFTTKKQATEFLEDFIDIIKDTVIAGDDVSIAGFGKFSKFERTADGAGTGVYKPKFTAFSSFKEAVNG